MGWLSGLFGSKEPKIHMQQNFERFGRELEVYNIEDFTALAAKFFNEAKRSNDELYTFVNLPNNQVGIDYNGQLRGIYKPDGTPIAFFKPTYKEFGYNSKDEELEDWKSGKRADYYQ